MKKIFIILSLLVIGLPVMCDDVAEEITVPKSEVIPAQSIIKLLILLEKNCPQGGRNFVKQVMKMRFTKIVMMFLIFSVS